jgi:predicted XRE-type DNA-binding protein
MARIKGDIFDNLGLSKGKASELKMRADILDAILGVVRRHRFTQKQLTEILGDHQPNVSDLLNGRIAKFSLEKLLRYADRLGIEAKVRMKERPERWLASAS